MSPEFHYPGPNEFSRVLSPGILKLIHLFPFPSFLLTYSRRGTLSRSLSVPRASLINDVASEPGRAGRRRAGFTERAPRQRATDRITNDRRISIYIEHELAALGARSLLFLSSPSPLLILSLSLFSFIFHNFFLFLNLLCFILPQFVFH